jgi:hypothetical protein
MHQRVSLITPAFANERCCALGRWLQEDNDRGGAALELLQLELAHASFHTIALVIALSITQGRRAEAAVMLEPDALFDSAGRMLADAVARFETRRIVGVGSAPASRERAQ